MARSLLDGIDVQDKSTKKASGGGGGFKGDPKLFAAIGLLVLAVGILVYWYVLRDAAGPKPVFEPAQIEEAQRQHEANVKQAEQTGAVMGGS